MSMLMRAAICGLKGAGSALGSPNWLWAQAWSDGPMTVAKAANAINGNVKTRMELPFISRHLVWWTLDPLQRALGLDRDLRIGARRRTPDDAKLLVAGLIARHFDVLGVDLVAKTGDFIGSQKVRARHDGNPVLWRHADLGVGN